MPWRGGRAPRCQAALPCRVGGRSPAAFRRARPNRAPRPQALWFLPAPGWCRDLPAVPPELGMGSRAPHGVRDAVPGDRVSQRRSAAAVATGDAESRAPSGPGRGSCLSPSAEQLWAAFRFHLSHTQNTAASPWGGGEKGNLRPFSLYFDRAGHPPGSLTRARSRDLALINTCKPKPPLHGTGCRQHPSHGCGADPLPRRRGSPGIVAVGLDA